MKYIVLFLLTAAMAFGQSFGLVSIAGGTFTQGDSFGEGASWELPQRQVTLSNFQIGAYEVTNAEAITVLQYAFDEGYITVVDQNVLIAATSLQIMRLSQAGAEVQFSGGTFSVRSGRGNHPVTWINWYGCVAFCNWASEIDGLQPAYNLSTWTWDTSKNGYRLPTEAEWEYAARAGAAGQRFPAGNSVGHSTHNYQSKDGLDYDTEDNTGYHPTYSSDILKSAPVGTFSANAFGLYEMAGNVYEIVWDRYVRYTSGAATNPTGPSEGSLSVWRGGSWKTSAANLRNAHRYRGVGPAGDAFDVGFRVAKGTLGTTTVSDAGVFYVAVTGNDSNPGTFASPWRTITKASNTLQAGQTVIIGDGDYNEHVQETTDGTAGAPITYQAANQHGATLRAFRIRGFHIVLDGLRFSGYSNVGNTWNSAVRCENDSDFAVIENCLFTGYPYVLAHDFRFDHAQNRIISESSNFLAAGFVPGSKVYLGASGATYGGVPLYYNNHDTKWTVSTVEQTSMTLTGGTMVPDSGTNYWAYIRAGADHMGNPCVLSVSTSSVTSDSITVRNNRVDDWTAQTFVLTGHNHLIEDNHITRNGSFRWLNINGGGHIIRRNVIRDCPNVLRYSQADMATIEHPEGTGWYDYRSSMFIFNTRVGDNNNNILFQNNWMESIDNQLGRVDSLGNTQAGEAINITFDENVFIGVTQAFNAGRPGMKWLNNTFYKCIGYNSQDPAHPLQTGARESDVSQTGYEILRNIFAACGPKGISVTPTRGFYSFAAWVVSPVANYNLITSEEVTGYLAKTNLTEANGVTGVDPIFVDEFDPDGPDDIPFTADDGLRVIANSAAASLNAGALGVRPVVSGQPQASFRIAAPTGWFEGTGEAYDPTWLSKLPTQRGTVARPWDVPVAIGTAPVAATFSAANSISGVGGAITNAAITNYAWNFGDGGTGTGQNPNHTFTSGGDFTVTLTVTNSAGGTHTTRRVYRVYGDSVGQVPPSAPTGLRLR